MNTSELTCLALDWAVAKCEDKEVMCYRADLSAYLIYIPKHSAYKIWRPSTDWAQGGPIIGRIKGLQLKNWLESKPETCCEVHIHNYEGDWIQFGPTPLIAAMRCYVASKLGDTVEIPEELK